MDQTLLIGVVGGAVVVAVLLFACRSNTAKPKAVLPAVKATVTSQRQAKTQRSDWASNVCFLFSPGFFL
jgi:hypothetical protein